MTHYQQIVRAKLFIDQQYDQPLTLGQLSDTAYFSKFHFLRLFRKLYQVTPHQYLTRRRIEVSKELLTYADASVTDISYRVGFQSVPHFNVTFRKWVGTYPTQYREKTRAAVQKAQSQPDTVIPFCFVRNHCSSE